MIPKETNSLSIGRALYNGLTGVPHFLVDISFVRHQVFFDDIYFDGLPELPAKLKALEETRKGSVLLDGGPRMKIWLEATLRGGLKIRFLTEQQFFPGSCALEGEFEIEGERTEELIRSFQRLISDGDPVVI